MFSKYIGLKYSNLGRDFSGVDCFGLIYLVYSQERKIILPDFTELKYNTDWSKKENYIVNNIWDDWIEVYQPYKLFDILLFYNSPKKVVVNHAAIYINNDKILHILEEDTTSQISRLDKFWTSKLYKVLRFKEEIKSIG